MKNMKLLALLSMFAAAAVFAIDPEPPKTELAGNDGGKKKKDEEKEEDYRRA
jgi:hypothetical protein